MANPVIQDNISELSAVLKTVFGPGVEQQQNLAAMLYKQFGASDVKFGGNAYEFPARMVNTQSVGARGYRVGLPSPILNVDVTARVRHKFIYGTFDIPGPDIEKGKGNINAFVNTLTDKMRSLTESVLKDLNMQSYLDGSGVRASCASSWTSGVVTVDRVKYLRVGMHVNVIANDGVTVRVGGDSDSGDGGTSFASTRFTVMAINPSTKAVTLGKDSPLTATSPTAAASTDVIVRHKAAGAELTGLGAIVDDGTYNGSAAVLEDIDRVANPLWKAKVLSNSGNGQRDITLQLLQIGMDAPEIVSGRKIDMLLGSYNTRDRYLQLLVPQKRYTDLNLDGGFQVLEYNGRKFLVDVDCPDDTIWLTCKDTIQKYGLFELAFVEQTGGILKHDSLAAGDVFYGFMRAICNLGSTQPNANTAIRDITVDSAYSLPS